jgi:histidine kinase
LKESLGENGRIIIDIIPDLELVIGLKHSTLPLSSLASFALPHPHSLGPQPEVPQLNGIESVCRFQQVFAAFIAALATKDHPLVIFLDDLQCTKSSILPFKIY